MKKKKNLKYNLLQFFPIFSSLFKFFLSFRSKSLRLFTFVIKYNFRRERWSLSKKSNVATLYKKEKMNQWPLDKWRDNFLFSNWTFFYNHFVYKLSIYFITKVSCQAWFHSSFQMIVIWSIKKRIFCSVHSLQTTFLLVSS